MIILYIENGSGTTVYYDGGSFIFHFLVFILAENAYVSIKNQSGKTIASIYEYPVFKIVT